MTDFGGRVEVLVCSDLHSILRMVDHHAGSCCCPLGCRDTDAIAMESYVRQNAGVSKIFRTSSTRATTLVLHELKTFFGAHFFDGHELKTFFGLMHFVDGPFDLIALVSSLSHRRGGHQFSLRRRLWGSIVLVQYDDT